MYIRLIKKSGSRIDYDVRAVLRDHINIIVVYDDLVIMSRNDEERIEVKLHFFDYNEALEFMENLKKVINYMIDMYLYNMEKFDFEELNDLGAFLRREEQCLREIMGEKVIEW